ncbi:MAG: hypothetical protein KF817_07665 [Phycisphaeraceae bacterium]|nr:hypothetical protein [Phycisphaeraceae bacterium]
MPTAAESSPSAGRPAGGGIEQEADGQAQGAWSVLASAGVYFTTQIEYEFMPEEFIDVTLLPGEPFERTFYMRRTRPSSTTVAAGETDLTGLSVEPQAVDGSGIFQPVIVRGHGPDRPGTQAGWVTLRLDGTPVDAWSIPIRVQTVADHRAIPAACIVPPSATEVIRQRVEPRMAGRSPARLHIDPLVNSAVSVTGLRPMVEGASAGESIWTVEIEILPERLQGRAGRAWIDVLDAEDREILRIPVLWLRSL